MRSMCCLLLFLFGHCYLLANDNFEKCLFMHQAISVMNLEAYHQEISPGKTAFLRAMQGCKSTYGDSVIHTWARFNGEAAMLGYLIKRVKLSIFDRTSVKETPLMLAAANGNLEAVKALLATFGATISYVNETDEFGRTALHRAVMANHPEILAELIGFGGAVHIKDDFGISVVMLVQRPKYKKCRKAFYRNAPKAILGTVTLPRDSDSESEWSDASSLLCSPDVSHLACIPDRKEVLLERMGDELALHRAVIHNDLALVKKVFSREKMNQVDSQGNTALHYFAEFGRDEKIFKHFIKRGADVRKKNHQGQTPLMLAVSVENVPNVKLLTFKNTINLQDKSNRTALHYAVLAKNEQLIAWLLENNADSWFVDSFNRTALEYADDLGLSSIFSLLKEALHRPTLSKEPAWECVKPGEKSSRGCSLFGFSSSNQTRNRSFSESSVTYYPFGFAEMSI